MATKTVKPEETTASPAKLTKTIDKLVDLREKKRTLESQVKDLDGQIGDLETEVLESLKANGMEKVSTSKATVSIGKSVVANVVDWDAFHAYIAKNKYFHLLQRRVSDPSYRELLEQGKKVPGVQPFNREKLSLRTPS